MALKGPMWLATHQPARVKISQELQEYKFPTTPTGRQGSDRKATLQWKMARGLLKKTFYGPQPQITKKLFELG
jgi:hypothetical protein